MAMSNNDPMNDDFNGGGLSTPTGNFFGDLIDQLGDTEGDIDLLELLLGANVPSPPGLSPEFNSNSSSQDISNSIPQAAAFPSRIQPRSDRLEIIAQPCYTSRIRTREDYEKENRRQTLKARKPNSPFTSPTIRIPQFYFNAEEQYYIGIFLVTTFHEKTNCRYFHPYELEDIHDNDRNEKDIGVWYPIGSDDSEGIKSFPNIRIVLRKQQDLKRYDSLRIFYGYTLDANLLNNVVTVLSSGKKMEEYNLKAIQLAFTIGKKVNVDDNFPTILDPHLTVFSDEMIEGDAKEIVENNKSIQSTTKSNLSPPDCRMYKYTPRQGYTDGNEEVLIFYTKKLEENKYGKLQVTFEHYIPNTERSAPVAATNIEVKGQMVSFNTPSFPCSISELTPVKIILQQAERMLEPLQYFYVPKFQCSTCQANMTRTTKRIPRNNAKKRSKSNLNPNDDEGHFVDHMYVGQTVLPLSKSENDDETDAMVPVCESKPLFQSLKPEPESHSSNPTPQPSINTNQADHDQKEFLNKLEEGVVSLFTNNNLEIFLRLGRPFIRKRPELLHQAISNNHSDLLAQFIPIAPITLLQQKNQHGETVLLHAIRLNRVNIVKTLLEKNNSHQLFDDVNDKEQNIFHLLAMNGDLEEVLELLIDHLLEKSIDIQEKFDDVDEDNHTPLQLGIVNNNLSTTRQLLKYFNKNVCSTNNDTGDNLIHLAARHGDLTMLKYVLNEGELSEQGTQTNLTMTPIELARSMKRNDMVEYLNELYPPPEVNEDESSDDD